MPRRKRDDKPKPLPTIWRVSDDLWARITPILAELDPRPRTGRPRIDQRRALDGIIYRLRSGVQWNQLPQEFGDDSSVHRTFQRWIARGVFERLWAVLVADCAELGGVSWEWQAADAALGKARLGGPRRRQPHRSGQAGGETQLAGGRDGGPLAAVVAGANVHDAKLLSATLEALVVARPQPSEERPQHLCLDKGDDNPTGRQAVSDHGYVAHIRTIGTEKLDEQGAKRYPARRGVVERTLAWLSKCRAGNLGALRQESTELPHADQTGLRPAVVPQIAPPIRYCEIDS